MSIDCIAALRSCVWLLEDVASLESLQAGLGATSFSDTTAICVSQTFDHTDSSVWWLFQRLILTFVPTLAEIKQIHAKSTLLEQSVHQIWREASEPWFSTCSMYPLGVPTHSGFIHHICQQSVGALYSFLHVLLLLSGL